MSQNTKNYITATLILILALLGDAIFDKIFNF